MVSRILILLLLVAEAATSNELDTTFCGPGSKAADGFSILNGYSRGVWPDKLVCHLLYGSRYSSGNGEAAYELKVYIQLVEDHNCLDCPSGGMIFNARDSYNYDYLQYASSKTGDSLRKCFYMGSMVDGKTSEQGNATHCVTTRDKWTLFKVIVVKGAAILKSGDQIITALPTSRPGYSYRKGGLLAKGNVLLFKRYQSSVLTGLRKNVDVLVASCGDGTGWLSRSQFMVHTDPSVNPYRTPHICMARHGTAWRIDLRRRSGYGYKAVFMYRLLGKTSTQDKVGISYNLQDTNQYDYIMFSCRDGVRGQCEYQKGYRRWIEEDTWTSRMETAVTSNGTLIHLNHNTSQHARPWRHEGNILLTLTTLNGTASLEVTMKDPDSQNYVRLASPPASSYFPDNGKVGLMLELSGREPGFLLSRRPSLYRMAGHPGEPW